MARHASAAAQDWLGQAGSNDRASHMTGIRGVVCEWALALHRHPCVWTDGWLTLAATSYGMAICVWHTVDSESISIKALLSLQVVPVPICK